jgi:uncharacterized OB-fold protein
MSESETVFFHRETGVEMTDGGKGAHREMRRCKKHKLHHPIEMACPECKNEKLAPHLGIQPPRRLGSGKA